MGTSIQRLHLLPLPQPVPRQLNALAGTHLHIVQVEQHQHNTVTRVPLRNATPGTNPPNVRVMVSHKRNVLEEAQLLHHQQGERAPHRRIAQVATGSSGKGRLAISSARALLAVDLPSREEVMPQRRGP